MNRYVLTGAPGAGKTAVIRQLECEGFGVVEEAATDIIALWQAKGIAEPWTHPEFIDAVVSLQQTRERRVGALPEVAQFYDRSVVCTAALADYRSHQASKPRDGTAARYDTKCISTKGFIAKEPGLCHTDRSAKDYLRRNGQF